MLAVTPYPSIHTTVDFTHLAIAKLSGMAGVLEILPVQTVNEEKVTLFCGEGTLQSRSCRI